MTNENKPNKKRNIIGLMSGTSADGIDAVLAEISGHGIDLEVRQKDFLFVPYSDDVRSLILNACEPGKLSVRDISNLNFLLGRLMGQAARELIKKVNFVPADITAIGSHGQTIWHEPNPVDMAGYKVRSTLQIGEPSLIAEITGCKVVADFRPRDMAAGGQGAPLVPYTDFILFRHKSKNRILQNIGGIANLTHIPANGKPEDMIAFDTGPGNMIIDAMAKLVTNGQKEYDQDGKMAAAGRVNPELLEKLLEHPYYDAPPPKSTGREVFGFEYAREIHEKAKNLSMSKEDCLATVTALTAETIARHYVKYIFGNSKKQEYEIIASGGGSRNKILLKMIEERIKPYKISTLEEIGWDGDSREAVAFAIMADAALRQEPNNICSATGAEHTVIMGKTIV
jgi:anhydro-N-acetylmuramic acid kinase